jgi:phosphatidylserine decarboxylase
VPVAVQAVPFVVALLVVALVLGSVAGAWGAAPAVLLILFVLYFFRDPERVPPEEEGLVLSPADGRVTVVEEGAGGSRISIFLSLFDCHVNRAPVSGTIRESRHTRGRYRPAWQDRASRENERNHLVIQAAEGEYGVTQIAGVVARRIVCTKGAGDAVRRGERIGLIRFGSRTDLLLPAGILPRVRVGDRVRGGLTIVARAPAAAGHGAPPAAGGSLRAAGGGVA